MKQPIKVGLVGLGAISERHLKVIEKENRFQLVAVGDIDRRRTEMVAKRFGVKAYLDYEKLLLDEEINSVIIATPSGLHASMIIAAAKAKKNIICEKPLALSLESAKKAIRACRQNEVKLLIVHQYRFLPLVTALNQAFKKKAFGQLVCITINVFWNRNEAYYAQASWRGTREMDGGILFNQANHHFDLLAWLGGSVSSVYALATRRTHADIELEDFMSVSLRFKSGVIGEFVATISTYPKNLEDSLVVIGGKGTVKITSVSGSKLDLWQFAKDPVDLTRLKKELKMAQREEIYGHAHFYEYAADILTGSRKNGLVGRESLESMELIEASYQSADQHQVISLT